MCVFVLVCNCVCGSKRLFLCFIQVSNLTWVVFNLMLIGCLYLFAIHDNVLFVVGATTAHMSRGLNNHQRSANTAHSGHRIIEIENLQLNAMVHESLRAMWASAQWLTEAVEGGRCNNLQGRDSERACRVSEVNVTVPSLISIEAAQFARPPRRTPQVQTADMYVQKHTLGKVFDQLL